MSRNKMIRVLVIENISRRAKQPKDSQKKLDTNEAGPAVKKDQQQITAPTT